MTGLSLSLSLSRVDGQVKEAMDQIDAAVAGCCCSAADCSCCPPHLLFFDVLRTEPWLAVSCAGVEHDAPCWHIGMLIASIGVCSMLA